MSTSTTSRKYRTKTQPHVLALASTSAHVPPPRPTLATVLAHIGASEVLTSRQRQDLSSALRTVARVLGRPPEEVSAHPGQLRDRLKGFVPATAGLSPRRWANAASLARQAFKHAGIAVVPGRSCLPFSPGWTALFRLVEEKYDRVALSRLARYCTSRDIEPAAVGNVVFAAFLEDLSTASMSESPRKVQRRAAVVWTKFARSIPSWPQQPITVPDYRRTYALPWSSFPLSLKADLDAYLDRLAGGDVLDAMDRRPLRPASLKSLKHELGIYVSALVHRGHDPQTLRTLRDVVTVPLVRDGLRFFLDRAQNRSTAQAFRIAFRVRGLAQHWVGVDAAHLAALRKLCKNLDPGQSSMTAKNRSRLRQFDDEANIRKLVNLPAELAAQVARCKEPTAAEALLLQTALAVEVLLMVPMRRKNLAHLDLERHFSRTRGGVAHLVIPAHEVKNSTEIAAVLPPPTVRLLDLYVQRYRPLLLAEPSPWLFPGLADRPKSLERLGLQISGTIKRQTGLLVNTHLFRHIAAKLFLDANPGAYGVVRLLHGHKSVDTTTNFYCGAESNAAFQQYDLQVIAPRRAPSNKPLSKRPRPVPAQALAAKPAPALRRTSR